MKKRFIFTMLALLLFSYTSISAHEYHKETKAIEYLLNERIKVINEFLYGCKDMECLEGKLNEIESGRLLKNDLDILYKVMDNPTDYELAMSVKVHKIRHMLANDDGYGINVDLDWLMRGYDGEFNIIKNYDIECVEINERVYIAELTIKQ